MILLRDTLSTPNAGLQFKTTGEGLVSRGAHYPQSRIAAPVDVRNLLSALLNAFNSMATYRTGIASAGS